MNEASYEKSADNMLKTENLPPPYFDSAQTPVQPPAAITVQPPMPGHVYYATTVQDPKEEPILQPAQFTRAPDYLAYSIFTMICCCLPFGVAALVYAIQTREANHERNKNSAQRNSRMARIWAHSALGVGITIIVLYITYILVTWKILK
ncbi:proline-rich transmembrane protein 1-like [Erythrolamprus reginae]|uniref:proline-rich transmembrane protein 1-like n=1 Tax=Erythrolamprus reginae TaxID=121349 RepID=UPI00396CA357